MKRKQVSPVRYDLSAPATRPETVKPSAEAVALAEIVQAVRVDCRTEPKSYLEEVRVSAAGE